MLENSFRTILETREEFAEGIPRVSVGIVAAAFRDVVVHHGGGDIYDRNIGQVVGELGNRSYTGYKRTTSMRNREPRSSSASELSSVQDLHTREVRCFISDHESDEFTVSHE